MSLKAESISSIWCICIFIKAIIDLEYFFSDSPYIWWSRASKSVIVCGGKNWDEDVSDSRCFSYDHCNNSWKQILDLPQGIYFTPIVHEDI